MTLIQLIVLATLAEAVWETSKMIWQEGKISGDRIGALVVGLLVSIGTKADLFALLELPFVIPYVGMILTGILISRGANYLHDIVKRLNPS